MRIALAVLMALHGVAHLVGFAGSWQLAAAGSIPFKTTVLAGHIDLGNAGIRAFGVLWLVAAFAFVVAAGGAALDTEWWRAAALATAAGSLALTVLEWPQARIGAWLNAAIIVVLLVGWRL